MFGWFAKRPKKASEALSPEVEAIFQKIRNLMSDEALQNNQLPEPFRSSVLMGSDCDEIAHAAGEFGRDPNNPIPVNGPIGELIYLSNLRTASSAPVLFHRLGSMGKVDAFEIVGCDGSTWDIVFLDLYHPRKSRRAPRGFQIATAAKDRAQLFFGTNDFVVSFPENLPEAVANTFERIIGFRMRPPELVKLIEKTSFRRPYAQQAAVSSILEMIEAEKTSGQRAQMLDAETEHTRSPAPATSYDEATEKFLSLVEGCLILQLGPRFSSLSEAFGSIMADKKAAGYVFGVHDALAQRFGLANSKDKTGDLQPIESSYKKLFGAQAGFALFDMSISRQSDPDFHKGRMIGGSELVELIKDRTPPMGLNRILFFHLDG